MQTRGSLESTYDDRSGLILCFGWDFQTIRIVPENLSLNKVDAMFLLVCLTFKWIKLEIHNGIINIPLWQIVSMRHLLSFAGLRSTERVEVPRALARGAPPIRLIATGIIRTSQAQKAIGDDTPIGPHNDLRQHHRAEEQERE